MERKFKKHLKDLKRLRAGLHPDPSQNLLLDRNERVIPYNDEIVNRLCSSIVKSNLNLYPDLEIFYKKLARWLSLDESNIYVTEGISGAIKSLIETVASPGRTVVFPTPTFALYPVYCRMFNLKYRTAGYTKDYQLDLGTMRRLIDSKTDIVFLPNPNVPIEGTVSIEEIASLAKYCARHKAFLVVDEVYFPFGGPSAIGLVKHFDNLFVMRSFSKAFGLAGIRLGYVVGKRKNIEYVSKTRTGYETNTLSAEIASFFLDNYHLVESHIRDVKDGLAYLKKRLDGLGLAHNGGNASNFIYVNLGDKKLIEKVTSALKSKGIHIRAGWPEPYSSGFCVTGAPKHLMERFAGELTKALKG